MIERKKRQEVKDGIEISMYPKRNKFIQKKVHMPWPKDFKSDGHFTKRRSKSHVTG